MTTQLQQAIKLSRNLSQTEQVELLKTIVEQLIKPSQEKLELLQLLQTATTPRKPQTAEPREMTARDLLESDLVGMWADRSDFSEFPRFATPLRPLLGLWQEFTVTEEDITAARQKIWANLDKRTF